GQLRLALAGARGLVVVRGGRRARLRAGGSALGRSGEHVPPRDRGGRRRRPGRGRGVAGRARAGVRAVPGVPERAVALRAAARRRQERVSAPVPRPDAGPEAPLAASRRAAAVGPPPATAGGGGAVREGSARGQDIPL